jgi:AAA family ATP:ADP antiporter
VVLFFGCIQLFFFAGRMQAPHVGFVFFVWVGIFSLTTIAQFWSYANELYTRTEGDRLFPLIAVGSTAGAPLGAGIAEYLFAEGMGPLAMMQVAAVLLLLHLVLYRLVWSRVSAAGAKTVEEPIKAGNGFALVLKSRYLSLIAFFLVLLNIVNTVGEYILGHGGERGRRRAAATAGFDKQAFILGAYYREHYFLWTNVATILIQAFLVSRLVKRFGMAGALFALPLVSLSSYSLAASGAGLMALLYVKIAENSTDYSVMNTTKQMLWLPTRREEKYKAKQAVDTFFVRTGDMLAAGVVFLGTHRLGFGVGGFAKTNVAVVLAAIVVAVLLLREYRRLIATRTSAEAGAGA